MSPGPASAIAIADGEITVDAELLAPKLGLSAKPITQVCSTSSGPRHDCHSLGSRRDDDRCGQHA